MFAYVSDFSGPTDGGGVLLAFRTVDFLLTATLPSGDHMFSAAPSPDGNFVYATTSFAQGSLAIVDTNILEVTGFVTGMGGDPSGVVVSPGGTRVYVAALSSARVNIVDAVNGVPTESIDVAVDPHALVLNPDHGELFAPRRRTARSSSSRSISRLRLACPASNHQVSTNRRGGGASACAVAAVSVSAMTRRVSTGSMTSSISNS
jgi:DNA-binding beta-propeller fold protein YncE